MVNCSGKIIIRRTKKLIIYELGDLKKTIFLLVGSFMVAVNHGLVLVLHIITHYFVCSCRLSESSMPMKARRF